MKKLAMLVVACALTVGAGCSKKKDAATMPPAPTTEPAADAPKADGAAPDEAKPAGDNPCGGGAANPCGGG